MCVCVCVCVCVRERGCDCSTEAVLERRVAELGRGGRSLIGRPTGQVEVKRIIRERDQLKEATSLMETELIQVHCSTQAFPNTQTHSI